MFTEHAFHSHGLPDEIISDQDSVFTSKFKKTLYGILDVKISPLTAYQPQTDRRIEMVNESLKR